MGMPGFSGFVAEFPIFMGVWRIQPWVAILAALSIVITAAYIMLAVRRTFFGEMPKEFEGHINFKMICDAATTGDKLAFNLIDEMGQYLGEGIVTLINLFNPELIIIGGEITQACDQVLNSIMNIVINTWRFFGMFLYFSCFYKI